VENFCLRSQVVTPGPVLPETMMTRQPRSFIFEPGIGWCKSIFFQTRYDVTWM